MGNLTGKVAVVTGASRGIGRGIAMRLFKEGASLVINYNSSEEAALEVVEEIKNKGGYAVAIKADVSTYSGAKLLIEKSIEQFGKLDILVNNAGVSYVGLFMDMKEDDWDKLINLNLKGVINCSHCCIDKMISQQSGSIINISSMWGSVGASCEVVYSATKGAVNMFTKSLAKEVAASKIRVNAIEPGVIDTEMNKWLSKEERETLEYEIPLGNFGTVEDVGNLVVFLASNKSNYLTGQVITLDGGMNC